MIRAGITGTDWTGKTTTIRTFREAHAEQRIDVVALVDFVRYCPHPMEQEQVPEASRWMLEHVRARLDEPTDADIQLFDRTPLDILAYTRYAYDRMGERADESLLGALFDLLDRFDHVFYAAPDEEWPIGVKPKPPEIGFALLMDWYIRKAMRTTRKDFTRLPWPVDERRVLLEERLIG